jgi:hypothetical protein
VAAGSAPNGLLGGNPNRSRVAMLPRQRRYTDAGKHDADAVAVRIEALARSAGGGDRVDDDVAGGINIVKHERGHRQQVRRVAAP